MTVALLHVKRFLDFALNDKMLISDTNSHGRGSSTG